MKTFFFRGAQCALNRLKMFLSLRACSILGSQCGGLSTPLVLNLPGAPGNLNIPGAPGNLNIPGAGQVSH